jgi:hypothetical protein
VGAHYFQEGDVQLDTDVGHMEFTLIQVNSRTGTKGSSRSLSRMLEARGPFSPDWWTKGLVVFLVELFSDI